MITLPRLYPLLGLDAACLAGSALTLPARAQEAMQLPPVNVDASRNSGGIVGTSTAVMTAEDIAHSPSQTIQDVLATIPGVQVANLFGAAGGTGDRAGPALGRVPEAPAAVSPPHFDPIDEDSG